MKRMPSKATLLKKRVRKIQNRAKFVGILYLLGTIGLVAIAACLPLLTGTCITDGVTMPVLTFYQPIVNLFAKGAEAFTSLTAAQITELIVVVLFGAMLLTMAINVLRSIGKLGWLFKRRASYSNGFNRNMYAMDDMAKRFSNSLYTLVVMHLFIYLFSCGVVPAEGQETIVQIATNAYIALGVGFGLHFVCGLIGGTVTLFSTGDRVEEETRENGLFVFFVRNLIQIAAVAAIAYFLIQESVLVAKIQELLRLVLEEQKPIAEIDWMSAIPAGIELIAWIFIAVLAGHAIADTEFNRDGVVGSGMRNFAIFSFLTALALAAGIVLPMLGIGVAEVATELNQNLLIAAAIALIAFLLDCIIRPRARDDSNYDDVDIDAYFQGGEQRYNNTII